MNTRSCPERAKKIADLILADPILLRDFLRPISKPPRQPRRSGPRCGRPVEPVDRTQLHGLSPDEADSHVALIQRVRKAAIERYGSVPKAESALGMRYKSLQGALRPDRIRIQSQRRILRRVAERLGVGR